MLAPLMLTKLPMMITPNREKASENYVYARRVSNLNYNNIFFTYQMTCGRQRTDFFNVTNLISGRIIYAHVSVSIPPVASKSGVSACDSLGIVREKEMFLETMSIPCCCELAYHHHQYFISSQTTSTVSHILNILEMLEG